jgi:CRP-like cAMP-binding protein
MKNHDTFRYFLYNNRIDEKILLKIIPHLKYEHIPKNIYFIREGDNSAQMFFILKGKVSFRKKIHNLRTENIIDNERFILEDNSNFGYWDIIYERKRKLSSYSLENCHLIIIEKEIFKKYLEEKIVKSEAEKKSFITKFLKSHMTLAAYKIDIIIQNIKTLHLRKGEIIYKEGSVNKSIYLVYKGEAKLIKRIKNGEFNLIGK